MRNQPIIAALFTAAVAVAACATSPAPSAPPSSPKAAENVDDIKENLRSFDKDVKAFASSAGDRSSVKDPNSFRAHELAGERNLSARAAELRRRIHAAFGAPPPPAPARAPAAPPPEQQALLAQLDASVKQIPHAPEPTTEADCRACGGDWAVHGILPKPSCLCPTSDAGQRCRDGAECQGQCLADDGEHEVVEAGPPARGFFVGKCSRYRTSFGCHRPLAAGALKAGPIALDEPPTQICAD